MAGFDTSIPMYDTRTGRFTMYGRNYLRSFYAETPSPSDNQLNKMAEQIGCPKLKLQVNKIIFETFVAMILVFKSKFISMRQYDKTKVKNTTNSNDQPNSSQPLLPQSSPVQTPEISIPIQFLNNISTAQAIALRDKILSKPQHKLLINPKHVDEEIKPEEISTFTSVASTDGK
ncbi:unnamed protein product [Rotaria sordida]|uniref:Uncharacterized protein n=1 Tax=Rotaria sordida TaxID=392033 RepID=A0A814ZV95_9BILA|nr:unnamed protein product [Rotaria sordida]